VPKSGAEPHLFVALGATGDLMARKLLPALCALHRRGEIPPESQILGVARHPISEEDFRVLCVGHLKEAKAGPEEELTAWCARALHYHAMGYGEPDAYETLARHITEIEAEQHLPGNRVFYLALPGESVPPVIEGLGRAGLAEEPGWTRLVVEKPFGRDLSSAGALNQTLHTYFSEPQVFRIDHYLGKETVQNLLVFRFANLFIESLWNRQWVDHVQITVAESLGIEGRIEYYDTAGAVRDMVQNHLTQLLTLIAMEIPGTFDAEAIRNEKVKVLRSVQRISVEDVVLGQYGPGRSDGQEVPGYRAEPGVRPGSNTATYAALRLRIANWRWEGVPFFIRTGKRLPKKTTRIVLTFRAPPVAFFQASEDYEVNPDRLTITLQPDEGFDLSFEIKIPGKIDRTQSHRMRFRYGYAFPDIRDAYETLLLDVIEGDQTHFVRADEVEESWRIYDPVIAARLAVHEYAAGSPGPVEADRLVRELGHKWNDD